MIPDDIIARIRESVNLAELVREHVPTLKKRGRNFMARCPFHEERTPSFNVNPEMGVFKCFGCGTGGDAFKFLMLTEGLTYPEAIHKLAARAGITIETERREEATAEAKERQVIYTILEEAAAFFHRQLMESADAEFARSYLAKRGLTPETLKKFVIGFAPAAGNALRDAASRKGWSMEIMEKAGLVRKKDNGRVYDAFWNRVMFPIWDVQGRMVGFGGRTLGDAQPKYINSPETPVYSKSRHLYGLFQGVSTLRKARHAIILEGYMDVATCHQYGLDQTMATLGTALTDEHVKLLRRYAERVTLLFDPDAAGAQASLRGGELLLADGFHVDVVTLPDGVDPDEILVGEGRASLEKHLESAVSFIDYFIVAAQKRHPGYAPETKLVISQEVLPLIQKIKDPLLADEYLGRLANVLRVDKTVLGQQMKRVKADRYEKAGVLPSARVSQDHRPAMVTIEEEIILLFLDQPNAELLPTLDQLQWQDARCAKLWAIVREKSLAGAFTVSELIGTLPAELQDWLTPLVLHERHYKQPGTMLNELIEAWRRQEDSRHWLDLKREIDDMIEGRIPMNAEKVQQYNLLSRRLKGSKPDLNAVREAPLHG